MISNHAVLMGRLTRDIEVRKTASDKPVASFTIAVNKPYNKEHDHPEADFFNCVAWEAKAEFIAKYFHKGDRIIVAGRLQTREYNDKDGKKQRVVELVVEESEFVEKRAENAPRADAPANAAPVRASDPERSAAPSRQSIESEPDELPF